MIRMVSFAFCANSNNFVHVDQKCDEKRQNINKDITKLKQKMNDNNIHARAIPFYLKIKSGVARRIFMSRRSFIMACGHNIQHHIIQKRERERETHIQLQNAKLIFSGPLVG